MNPKQYDTIDSYKGKLSRKSSESELPYQRAQYIDFMM
ncbi:MAG TPA: dihydroorotate dehydrogenase, partial [Bacteroidales bacterium]|nr:dihydroorotate dehydrogenase [Bacteroidales bacterium]